MKKIFLVIVILVSIVGVQAQEKLTDKHITINPQKPAKDGIDSGWVIMFGHLMSPPFQVEYRGEKIFINNIQAYPSPLSEEQVDKPLKAKYDKIRIKNEDMRQHPEKYVGEKELRIWARSQCPFNTKTPEERDVILKHILAHKELVDSAAWVGTGFVKLVWHGETWDSYIDCYKPSKIKYDRPALPIAEQQAQAVRAKRERLEDIKKTLAEGGCVLFTTDTGQGICSLNEEMRAVLLDKTLSMEERKKKLATTIPAGIAEDIMTNYIPEEWEALRSNK